MTAANGTMAPLAAVIAEAKAPLLMVDGAGVVLAANRAFEEQFGFIPSDVEALDVLGATESGRSLDFATLLRRGSPSSGIARVRAASGTVVRAGYGVTRLGGGDGDSGGAILALEPLGTLEVQVGTELVSLTRALLAQIWVTGPDGSTTVLGGGAPGSLDQTADPPLANMHPDDLLACGAAWKRARLAHVRYEARARHQLADGAYAEFSTRAVPLATTDGEVLGWLGVRMAIEPDASAAGDVAGVEGRLETASHEIRTPLAVLRGTAQLALRRAQSRALTDAELREALTSIEQQADRAIALVEQLLDSSRTESGSLRLQRASHDVSALARQVLHRLDAATETHQFALQADGPVFAEIDGERIEQVLLNLLDNAMKFSPRGSTIEVSVRGVPGAARPTIELAVRDYGRGVPLGQEERIFERFHQVTRDDATRGLGVGLAVCREIVELHGGTIAAATPRGGGARFVVRLPAPSD